VDARDVVPPWPPAAGRETGAPEAAGAVAAAGSGEPAVASATAGSVRPRASATRRTLRIRVAFSTITVMVAPEMLSMATWPSTPLPMTTLSNTDLPWYCRANCCRRSSVMPTTRMGSWCSTMRMPTICPARSKPTSVLMGWPE
jgi:hypothetical protein